MAAGLGGTAPTAGADEAGRSQVRLKLRPRKRVLKKLDGPCR
jgi:hypothetical protein